MEFVELDGDAQLEVRAAHALKLAAVIRRVRPGVVLAPSLVENAARLARYGGVVKLRAKPAHAIGPLFFYAVTPEAEPAGVLPVLLDISSPKVIAAWIAAMEAHATQLRTRNYVELQLARARAQGLRAGVDHAQPLYPHDALVFDSLAPLTRAARRF